jgi:ribosomal protein L7Ae-like RNA K-turn-binding protein
MTLLTHFCTLFSLSRLCVIAGNISPIDVITHVPILCEEANIPYVYVPSKEV